MNNLRIGEKVIIKYSGAKVSFGQCYDGATGMILYDIYSRFKIKLDEKSSAKIEYINYKTGSDWTLQPCIPFQFIYPQSSKRLELE